MTPALAAALRKQPLFLDGSEACFQILEAGEEISLSDGQRLLAEGEPADYFYVLLRGMLRVTKRKRGREVLFNTYHPGTFFGEVPILLDSPYVATAVALEDCNLFRLCASDFHTMLGSCPEVNRRILRAMAERILKLQAFSQELDQSHFGEVLPG